MDFGTEKISKIGDSYFLKIPKKWIDSFDFLKELIGVEGKPKEEGNEFVLKINESKKIILYKKKQETEVK